MRTEKTESRYGPALSVTGVSKTHGTRAVAWMRRHNLPAFYNASDKSLNAIEFKFGRDWTYEKLEEALRETK